MLKLSLILLITSAHTLSFGMIKFILNSQYRNTKSFEQRIHHELNKNIEQLERNEIAAVENLRQTFGVDPEEWDLDYARFQHKFNLESMKKPWPNAHWDQNLPSNVKKVLREVIQKNGLCPEAFRVIVNKHDSPIATYRCPLPKAIIDHDKKQFMGFEQDEPATVWVNQKIENDTAMLHILNHEITHALNGHGARRKALLIFLKSKTGQSYEDIKEHPAVKNMDLASENTADAFGLLRITRLLLVEKVVQHIQEVMSLLRKQLGFGKEKLLMKKAEKKLF